MEQQKDYYEAKLREQNRGVEDQLTKHKRQWEARFQDQSSKQLQELSEKHRSELANVRAHTLQECNAKFVEEQQSLELKFESEKERLVQSLNEEWQRKLDETISQMSSSDEIDSLVMDNQKLSHQLDVLRAEQGRLRQAMEDEYQQKLEEVTADSNANMKQFQEETNQYVQEQIQAWEQTVEELKREHDSQILQAVNVNREVANETYAIELQAVKDDYEKQLAELRNHQQPSNAPQPPTPINSEFSKGGLMSFTSSRISDVDLEGLNAMLTTIILTLKQARSASNESAQILSNLNAHHAIRSARRRFPSSSKEQAVDEASRHTPLYQRRTNLDGRLNHGIGGIGPSSASSESEAQQLEALVLSDVDLY